MSDASMPGDVPPPPLGGSTPHPEPWTPTGAIAYGWNVVWANPVTIGVFLVGLICQNALGQVGSLLSNLGAASGGAGIVASLLGLGLVLVNIPISIFFSMNMIRYSLRVVRGQPSGIENLFDFDFGPYWSLFAVSLIFGIAVFVGCVCFIVPGVILYAGWLFSFTLAVDRGLDPVESLKQSWAMTSARKGELVLFVLLTILVLIAGLAACGVGLFVAFPVATLAGSYTYVRFLSQNAT